MLDDEVVQRNTECSPEQVACIIRMQIYRLGHVGDLNPLGVVLGNEFRHRLNLARALCTHRSFTAIWRWAIRRHVVVREIAPKAEQTRLDLKQYDFMKTRCFAVDILMPLLE